MNARVFVCCLLLGCSNPASSVGPDAAPVDASTISLPPPIDPSDFGHALDRAYIRSFQTWIDDAAFDTKWAAMVTARSAFLGGADSAFHADLASRSTPLPGGEVLCHGDAKIDNFAWIHIDGQSVFSNGDFDDGGACPAAADILHFLVATDLFFGSPELDQAALDAYVAALASDATAPVFNLAAPRWDNVRMDGVDKATKNGQLSHGGEIEAASSQEVAAITSLVAGDARFPTQLVDVARDVVTIGGSAGLRRFWLLIEDAQHPRTIIELKELATPGTEFGPHSTTYDGADRFDVLKTYWWNAPVERDHFGVTLLNARFLARDRYARVSVDPTTLTFGEIESALRAEASLLGIKHRAAWSQYDIDALEAWLQASAVTLTTRWRTAYTLDGGT